MKQAFWKIPKEWVLEWGLTANEAILLADIVAWPTCSIEERATRIGVTRRAIYNLVERVQKCEKSSQFICEKFSQPLVKKVHKKCEKNSQNSVKSFHIPPHPPIIEERDIEEREESITPNGVPKADASAVKKKKKNEPSLQHRCRLFFEQIYEQKKGNKYYYSATDANALKQLLQKIRYLMPEDIKDDEQELERNFQIFIQVICTSTHVDAWVMDNLSLKIINSKFNEIYNQIKNGRTTAKPKQQQQGVTDEYIRRTAEQVAANGGLAF